MPSDLHRPAPRNVFTVLVRGWAVILGAAIVLGLCGLVYSMLQKPVYEAKTTLFITSGSTVVPTAYDAVKASEERIGSYAQLVYADAVLSPAVKAAGLDMSLDQARSAVGVDINPQIVMLTIFARDHDPETAQRLANAVADSMTKVVSRLEVPGSGGEPTAKLSTVTTATVGASPVTPTITINVLLSVVAGLVLGVVFLLLRERLNRQIRDEDDAAAFLDAPVLANVPFDDTLSTTSLVHFNSASTPFIAAFRQLRTVLQAAAKDDPIRTVLVTSPHTGEGKTTVAVNLGAALAQTGNSVVVVDANLNDPRVAEWTGCSPGPGLTDAIRGNVGLAEILQPGAGDVDGLTVLGAGSAGTESPEDLLSSKAFGEILDELSGSFDYVLVDAPALLDTSVVPGMIPWVRRALVVVRRKVSNLSDLNACRAKLDAVKADVVGVVLCDPLRRGAAKVDHRPAQHEMVAQGSRRSAPPTPGLPVSASQTGSAFSTD